MSYQVLARKYRPRSFRETLGQEHVLQALVNALDHDRLHHAYLFTGTRGVGKTTIARILAKCLNCETGVSSEPCGQCSACVEIAENRFVDLIEVDAASRTKVEDTRELLENVQYAPTRGRYKVYLIDEVHMLSGHSFNALLKTLEEPPPHVKFLLATTDPQKLPVTILSRCLQFNLKNMNPERIVEHLKTVLEKELVPFEESALWLLSRSADGSMRDALSLTDQAIAYGSGKITEAEVAVMLGSIDRRAVYDMLSALAEEDGKALLGAVERMSEQAPDYAAALAELLTLLHRIAIAQALPEALDNSQGDRDKVLELAQQIAPEDVQLFYQTALLGRRDLPLAPEPRAGLEMVLLRMLAFKPQGLADLPKQPLPSGTDPSPGDKDASPGERLVHQMERSPADSGAEAPSQEPAPSKIEVDTSARGGPDLDPKPQADPPAGAGQPAQDQVQPSRPEPPMEQAPEPELVGSEVSVPQPSEPPARESQSGTAPPPDPFPAESPQFSLTDCEPHNWARIYRSLKLGGLLQATAANCVLQRREGNVLHFVLDQRHSALFEDNQQRRLAGRLSQCLGEPVDVRIEPGQPEAESPAVEHQRLTREKHQAALEAIQTDPMVQRLMAHFGAKLRADTVKPLK